MMGNELTRQIIGAAIEVHRTMEPGLLESVYEECLAVELGLRNIPFGRQLRVPVTYKGPALPADLRMDFLIADPVVVELKATEKLLPIHSVQVLTYLRLTNEHLGLLINFNVPLLREGVTRIANSFSDLCASASLR
jgi:GxxExxY protein